MLYAVIMAGGAGTRFWPASRVQNPKQLLNLSGDRSMIQATVDRLDGLATSKSTLIVTNQRLVDPIREQLPDLPAECVVGEPCKRDTAPCIGLAAHWVMKQDPEAVMAVMPADHVIKETAAFQNAMRHAMDLIEEEPSRIITFGIKPTYPAESFGYVEREGDLISAGDQPPTYSVKQFREKPNAETAAEFLRQGCFYWNSGIFVWKARTIIDALQKYEPEMGSHLATIGDALETDEFDATLEREFAAIKGKSIDFAVMEHYKPVVVVEAPFDWDDVGNWPSLERLRDQDAQGNTIVGKHLGVNTKGTIVRTDGEHLIVTMGMEDCIIVHTPDATLVARKQDEESIRKVVKELEERGWQEYL